MFWVLTLRFSLPQKVPARVLVVQANAFTRLAVTSAERSRSALTMACVRATAPSAPRRSPRPTSPPATERLKSASTGWVAEEITPWRTGCHSSTVLILASVWSRLSSCSSSAGLLRLHLWEVRARGVYLCQPRWQGWDRALPRVLHGEKWVIYPFSHLLQAGSFFYKYTGEFCLFFFLFFKNWICLSAQQIPAHAAAQDQSAWLVSSIKKSPRCQLARLAMTLRATAMCSWSADWWTQMGHLPD